MNRWKMFTRLNLILAGLVLMATPIQAFSLMEGLWGPIDWTWLGGSPVTVSYFVNPNCSDPNAPNELETIQAAMESWTNAGANFAYNYAGATSVTNFTYGNFQNDICWNPGSSGNALATTSAWYSGNNITQFDIVIWDVWAWSTSWPGGSEFDVQSVTTHEAGHGLGLDHSEYPSAVMWWAFSPGQVKRDLYFDDVDGIIYIYGTAGGPELSVDLTPTSSVNIPGSGGSINYDAEIHNNTGSSVNFDGWTCIEQVGGGYTQEFIVRTDLMIGGSGTISRSLVLTIAGSVPNGTYDYYLRVGNYYTQEIIDEDSFEFYKYGGDGSEPWVWESSTTWWDDPIVIEPVIPETFQVSGAYPNPFNPETTIEFDLPEASNTLLSVYNLRGQKVVDLLSGKLDAGHYGATWNAADYPSGTYVYRLSTDLGQISGKVVLLK